MAMMCLSQRWAQGGIPLQWDVGTCEPLVWTGGGRWLEGTAGADTEASPALLKPLAGFQEGGLSPGYLWPIQ